MEFKGTKGKWKVNKNSTTLSTDDKKDFITCWIFQPEKEEAKANALLISKAPEMLEMLKDIYSKYQEKGHLLDVSPSAIEQLIKEATEL